LIAAHLSLTRGEFPEILSLVEGEMAGRAHGETDTLPAILMEKLAASSAPPPALTRRSIARPWQFPGKATAVIGMRPSGKTWFLHQLRHERAAAGIPYAHMPHINFEDDRLTGLTVRHLSAMVEQYYRGFPELRGKAPPVLCRRGHAS